MSRLTRFIPYGLLGLVIGVIGTTVYHRAILSVHRRSDFLMLYAAGTAARSGGDIYEVFVPRAGPYYYPPTTAAVMTVFTFLPVGGAVLAWYALSWAALLWAGSRLVRLCDGLAGRAVGVLVVAAFVVNFGPVVDGLHRGQMSAVLFALMVEAFWSYRRGRSGWCGVWIAVAASLKVYPALMVLPLLVRRDGRGLLCFGVALVALLVMLPMAVMGPVQGWAHLQHWTSQVLFPFFTDSSFGDRAEFAQFSQFGFANQSLYPCLVRYLGDSSLPDHRKFAFTVADWPTDAIRRVASIISLGLIAVMVAIMWRRPGKAEREGMREAMIWCLPVVAAHFISHIAWHNYYTVVTMMYAVAGTAVFMRRSGAIGAGEATGRSGGLPVEVGGAIPACAPIPGPGHLGWALGFALLCNWLHFASNFCRQMGLLLLGTLVLWVVLCAAIVRANPAGDDSSSVR